MPEIRMNEEDIIEYMEWKGVDKKQAEKILQYFKKPQIAEEDLGEIIDPLLAYVVSEVIVQEDETPLTYKEYSIEKRVICPVSEWSVSGYKILNITPKIPELDAKIAIIAVIAVEWAEVDSLESVEFDLSDAEGWCVYIVHFLFKKIAELLKVNKLTKYYGDEPQQLKLQYQRQEYNVEYDVEGYGGYGI